MNKKQQFNGAKTDISSKAIHTTLIAIVTIVIGLLIWKYTTTGNGYIGDQIILSNDTLTVIDKSSFGKLKLSNGVTISIESYKKLKDNE